MRVHVYSSLSRFGFLVTQLHAVTVRPNQYFVIDKRKGVLSDIVL